jgi:hypothetical protein
VSSLRRDKKNYLLPESKVRKTTSDSSWRVAGYVASLAPSPDG